MKKVAQQYAHWNWALLDQALVSGSNFLIGILLVRYIGIEQYGRYVLAWMVVQFVASLQSALIVSPMLSIVPKIPIEERRTYLSATFFLQMGLVILIGALALVYSLFPKLYDLVPLTRDSLLPVGLCLGSVQLQDYTRRNLFARTESRRAFSLDVVAYGVQIPLIFIVLRVCPSFENAMLVTAAAMLLAIGLGYRWIEISAVPNAYFAQVAIRHWRSSKWLLGSAILQWMSGNYFVIVAGLALGPAEVGAIRAAQNLLGLTHILFQGLENIVPGEASHQYHKGGPQALLRYTLKVALVVLTGTALLAVPAAIFAKPLLEQVYGTFDQQSASAIIWFVPIYMLVAITLPLRAGLRSLERTKAVFVAYIASTVFALCTANHLVVKYAVDGVMFGIAITQVIMVLVLSITVIKELRVKWK